MKLMGERLYIRAIHPDDTEAMVDIIVRNRAFFAAVEPKRNDEYYTVEIQRQNLVKAHEAFEQGKEYFFGIFLKEGDRLIGDTTLYDVRRWPYHSGSIGYAVDQPLNGNGYASEALQLALRFAFEHLHLHRVAAGVMPRNVGPIRVLEKLGFQREGLSRQNMEINGAWEDHFLYGLLHEEWKRQPE